MSDYIPRPDPQFREMFQQFNNWAQANGLTHGATAGQLVELDDGYALYSTSYDANLSAQTTAQTASQTKDSARDATEPLIRFLARIFQGHPATTDADRVAAGLTVRDTARTPAPAPTTRPVLMVDNRQRLLHVITFKDETTPNSKKKPAGVIGCEIRCYVGDTPPSDPEQYDNCGLAMTSPYSLAHEGGNVTKNAYIVGRWVNKREEKGPWSESVMATISA